MFSCIKMLIFSKIFLLCGNSTGTFICQRSLLRLPTKPPSSANEAYCVFPPYIPYYIYCLFFDFRSFDDNNILEGTVIIALIGFHILDFLYHIQSFKHFAKDCIATIKMGHAAIFHISCLHLLVGNGVHLVLAFHLLNQIFHLAC